MLLSDICNDTLQECANASLLVGMTNEFYNSQVNSNGVTYSDDIHYCVIDGAFLKLFMAFEKFLECSFICYMIGQAGNNGKTITRYVYPPTEEKAFDMLKGLSRFADFTNRETVIKLANNFFDGGGTYIHLNGISVAFEEMKKIRNAISHVSIDSERTFLNLARAKLGSLPPNINTAVFLNTVMSGTTSTFFVYYRDIIVTAINNISNPP